MTKYKFKFIINDVVILLRKKSNGYPKRLEFNKEYTIVCVNKDQVGICIDNEIMYINTSFFIKRKDLRDILIKKILKK